MLSILPVLSLPSPSSATRHPFGADLARFSLDLSSARLGLRDPGPGGPWPSPSMSGSPRWPNPVEPSQGDSRPHQPQPQPQPQPPPPPPPQQEQQQERPQQREHHHGQAQPTGRGDRSSPGDDGPGGAVTTAASAVPRREPEPEAGSQPQASSPDPSWPVTTRPGVAATAAAASVATTATTTATTTTTTTTTNPATTAEALPPPYLPITHDDGRRGRSDYPAGASPPERGTVFPRQASSRSSKTPRRPKAHVPYACVHCRNAHLSCDVSRPCARCVATGKQDTCVDVEHKKRGRPRIRTHEPRHEVGRGTHRGQRPLVGPMGVPGRVGPAMVQQFSAQEPFRPLLSRPIELSPSAPGPRRYLDLRAPGAALGAPAPIETAPGYAHPGSGARPPRDMAIAYMNMDLVVESATDPFCYALRAYQAYFEGRNIRDRLARCGWSKMDQLRISLGQELATRDPAYLPPIYGDTLAERLQRIQENSLSELTQGSRERLEDLTFVLPDGQHQTVRVRFQLAKLSVYFVVMVLLLEGSPRRLLPESPLPPSPHPAYAGPHAYSSYRDPQRPVLSPGGFGEGQISPPYFVPSFRAAGPMGRRSDPRSTPAPAPAWARSSAEQFGPRTPVSEQHHSSVPGPSPTSDYPRELQLPPIRSPAQAAPAPASRPSRKRAAEDDDGDERERSGADGSRQKRQRVSVEEILE